jgi:hypothetical protein
MWVLIRARCSAISHKWEFRRESVNGWTAQSTPLSSAFSCPFRCKQLVDCGEGTCNVGRGCRAVRGESGVCKRANGLDGVSLYGRLQQQVRAEKLLSGSWDVGQERRRCRVYVGGLDQPFSDKLEASGCSLLGSI